MSWLGLLVLLPAAFAVDCTLLGGRSPSAPSPSLVKCYRYNKLACCISAHDQTILTDYQSLTSTSCQREYDNLEDYFCFGCHPDSGDYVNIEAQEIYFCESYAEVVWGDSLDGTSSSYDDCGLYTYWRDTTETVMQSDSWANGYEFFAEVKPPYFSNYTIIIVGDDDDTSCFGSAGLLVLGGLVTVSFI
jgi:hypothetical protein